MPLPVQLVTKLLPLLLAVVVDYAARLERIVQFFKTGLGEDLRLAGRRGNKRAAMAVAHSILVIAYHILRNGVPNADLGADFFDRRAKSALAARFKRRLEALGYTVSIQEAA